MANSVYTIARPRKTFCIPNHYSHTSFPSPILKILSSLDVLWRQNGAGLWLRDVFAVTRGRVS